MKDKARHDDKKKHRERYGKTKQRQERTCISKKRSEAANEPPMIRRKRREGSIRKISYLTDVKDKAKTRPRDREKTRKGTRFVRVVARQRLQ